MGKLARTCFRKQPRSLVVDESTTYDEVSGALRDGRLICSASLRLGGIVRTQKRKLDDEAVEQTVQFHYLNLRYVWMTLPQTRAARLY